MDESLVLMKTTNMTIQKIAEEVVSMIITLQKYLKDIME